MANIFVSIKTEIDNAPRNDYSAELHLQIIKYAAELQNVTGKEFCDALDLKPSYGTEFSKMRKISARLKKAGLDVAKI